MLRGSIGWPVQVVNTIGRRRPQGVGRSCARCLEQALPGSHRGSQSGLKAIGVWWLDDIVIPAVLTLGVYCFVVLVRSGTRAKTRKTNRTVENMYPLYADSIRKQRKYATEHGGTWEDNGGSKTPLTKRLAPPPKTARPMPSPTPKPRP
jgi:hypothetical protein